VLVANDVSEGWITPARARDVYRVAIAEDGTVDRQETERLRA
jgi:N-methylhydantoinase B